MSKDNEEIKPLPYELPWPKELSQGMGPGLLWSVTSFFLFLLYWPYGLLSTVLMFIFFQTQRKTPIGRARRYYVQGRLAYRKDQWEEALENFVKAIEIKPDATAAYPVVGDLYFYFGDIAQFKKAYQQYFQLNTQDHHMRIWYAGKFMEIGQFAEAAKELKKLPAEQKKEPQVANLLGVCLLKTGQEKEALQVLGPVALKSEGTGEQELTSRYFLAKAYLQTGEKEKARKVLRKLQVDQPGFEDVEELLKKI